MSSKIPDRWLQYNATGVRIGQTPFVAFKCPLSESFLQLLPTEERFGPHELKVLLPDVSLIIDLTNTTKYYTSQAFRDIGIEYEKIAVPGHVLPRRQLLKRFFLIVDNFISEHNSDPVSLIGVHCTHGVNRTGFFICSYMISKLGYSCQSAVEEFNSARGHVMERDNYLQKLKTYEECPLVFVFQPDDFIALRNSRKRPKKRNRNRHRKRNAETPAAPPVQAAPFLNYYSPAFSSGTSNTRGFNSRPLDNRQQFPRNQYGSPSLAQYFNANSYNYYRDVCLPSEFTAAPSWQYNSRKVRNNRARFHENERNQKHPGGRGRMGLSGNL